MSVIAVNVPNMQFLTDSGVVCDIETLVDRDGDETDQLWAAVAAVGRFPDGTWVAIDLTAFAPGRVLH